MLFLDVDCASLAPIVKLIKLGLVPIIKIGIPIILIILGMFDLGKAVIASKEDEIKAAQKLLIKRIIYAVAIFFVVTIITLVFNLVDDINKNDEGIENVTTWHDCWTKTDKSGYHP